MLRCLPLVLLSACSLFGLSSEQEAALYRHQSNASIYWEGGNLGQAMDQVRRGLEIDPEDYKLHTIRAWCLLRESRDDPRRLDTAVAAFDRVLELRADSGHSAQARLGYAEAHGLVGLRLITAAADKQVQAERLAADSAQRAVLETQAREMRATAQEEFNLGEAQLQRLVDYGDSVLLAHYNLMTIKWWREDYNAAVENGQAYIERVTELQESHRRELQKTMVIEYENELRGKMQRLIDDEVRVRGFLANIHYKRGHHELVVQQLDEVLAKAPRLYNEYYNRARSLLALERRNDAKRDFERFLSSTNLPLESPQVREAAATVARLK